MQNNISSTFCALPWVHLSTRPDGSMRVCCTANASGVQDPDSSKRVNGGNAGIVKNENNMPANLNHTSLNDAWNNEYMCNVRKTMLKGEKPTSCLKCFKEEEAGVISKRQWETDYWGKIFDLKDIVSETKEDGSIPAKIRYLDLRLGSKCQLACVMCSPHDSSGWVKEWNEIYPKIENENLKRNSNWHMKGQVGGASYNWHLNNPTFWQDLYDQIPHMYQLYFAGGESTIIKEHYLLLEECIKRGYAKQIELRYNSNGIELPEKLFELWSHFRLVKFHFSIDAFGKQNEYIRYPTDWNTIEKNLHILDNTPDNVEVTIACTLMALNIYYFPDFIKWKLTQGFKKINKYPYGAGTINTHFAYYPPQLNVKVLPKEFKQKIVDKYENDFFPWLEDNWKLATGIPDSVSKEKWFSENYSIKRYKSILNFMNKEDWSQRLPETAEWIKRIDETRGLNFYEIFPDFNWLKNYE